jgi:hypothetical protein
MRALELTAIAALVEGFDLQRIVRTANAPAMRRYFSFWDSHSGTCSLDLEFENVVAALGQGPAPRKRGGGCQPCGEGAPYSGIRWRCKLPPV